MNSKIALQGVLDAGRVKGYNGELLGTFHIDIQVSSECPRCDLPPSIDRSIQEIRLLLPFSGILARC